MSSALEQRPFGRTGEKVSVIGLGGAGLYKHSYDLGVATVKHALDLGVSYFDTSPAYGRAGADGSWTDRGMSQLIMGEGLDGTTRPHLLATKLISYTTDVRGSTSRSPVAANPIGYRTVEDCRAQLFDNLRALRRDRVDVLLGHDMEKAKGWIPDAQDDDELLDLDKDHDFANATVIQALREAKGQGLCRYIGLSSNRSAALAHFLRRVELDVCLSAGEYTLLDRRSPQTMLPVVREQGIPYVVGGIFKRDFGASDAASPFQLALKGPLASVGAVFSDERLIRLAKTTGISIAALTVRYLIANRELSTILVGASTPEEIEENVVAAQAGPLPPDIHQALEGLHEEENIQET
ncbi:MAG: aldo/keto reductase [Dehalococcoidia bacterium]|nr:aldo/keto reductase [Dehalococcoidia bacterium]